MNRDVEVALGYTKNMGDFESLRLDFGAGRDLKPDETNEEALRDVYNELETLFLEHLTQLVKEVDGIRKNSRR